MAWVGRVRTAEAALVSSNRLIVLIYTIADGDSTDCRTAGKQRDRRRRTAIVLKKARIQIGIRVWDSAGTAGALKLQIEPIVHDR